MIFIRKSCPRRVKMRKYIIALASVIFLLAAAACSQGPDDHSGPDVTKVETAEDLVLFLADSGPGIADVNLAISPDDLESGQFPMEIRGTKQLSGRIEITTASADPLSGTADSDSVESVSPVTLFLLEDDAARVIISRLTVTVQEEAADMIASVVSVCSGQLSASDFNVEVIGSGGKTVTGIIIGDSVAAENIDISDSCPGEISISDTSEYSAILDKIIRANPDMPTAYDAEDAGSFLSLLQSEKRVRLVSDVTVTAADVSAADNGGSQEEDDEAKISLIGGEYSIYLNGFTLESQVVWNLMKSGEEGDLSLKVSDGSLSMRNLTEKEYSPSEAAIWIYSGTDIEFDNVDYTSEITGIKFVGTEKGMKLSITDSDFSCDGEYAISTDASSPLSEDVEISISSSSITSDNGFDNTAILFNVLGSLSISDCTITGDRQALFLRGGGPHNLIDSIFTATGEDSTAVDYADKGWGGGNDAVLAAIVIGNRSENGDSTYPPGTSVFLRNVTVQTPSHNTRGCPYYGIYIYEEIEEKPVVVEGSIRQSFSSQAAVLVNSDTNGADVDLN